MVGRRDLARVAAPAALLVAATALVLLVRSALDTEPAATSTPTATSTTTAPPATTGPAVTTEAPPTTAEPPATTEAANFYTIESGDTLESIADQYGTTVEELLRLNPDVDPVNLTIGQRIRVP